MSIVYDTFAYENKNQKFNDDGLVKTHSIKNNMLRPIQMYNLNKLYYNCKKNCTLGRFYQHLMVLLYTKQKSLISSKYSGRYL